MATIKKNPAVARNMAKVIMIGALVAATAAAISVRGAIKTFAGEGALGTNWPKHKPEERAAWLKGITEAVGGKNTGASCDALSRAGGLYAASIAGRFGVKPEHVSLDLAAIETAFQEHGSCQNMAQRLARTLQQNNELNIVFLNLRRQPGPGPSLIQHRAKFQDRDLTTLSAWYSMPGCIHLATGEPLAGCEAVMGSVQSWPAWTSATNNVDAANDTHAVIDAITPAILSAAAIPLPDNVIQIGGKKFRQGADVTVRVDPNLQALGQQLADCATAVDQKRAGCAASFRAAMLSAVLVDTTSGAIAMLIDSRADCLFTGQPPCSNHRLPGYFATAPSWAWPVNPGSVMKTLVTMAGLMEGLVKAADQKWQAVIAQSADQAGSHLQNLPRRMVLFSASIYRELLGAFGIAAAERVDIAFGNRPGSPLPAAQYQLAEMPMPGALALSPEQAWDMFRKYYDCKGNDACMKAAVIAIRNKYGAALEHAYPSAVPYLTSAIGGGETKVSALGVARLFYLYQALANGITNPAELHVAQVAGASPGTVSLPPRGIPAAAALLDFLRDVGNPALHGTAAGACLAHFGNAACRGKTTPVLLGKTGTGDVRRCDEPAEDTGQTPSKLFGGLIKIGDKTYALGVVALRTTRPTRDGGCAFDSNNAAAHFAYAFSSLADTSRHGATPDQKAAVP